MFGGRSGVLWVALITSACPGPAPRTRPAPAAVALPPRVTGANLRAVGDPKHGYGTRTARRTLERLQGLGVNTIGVLMEGRMAGLESTTVERPSPEDEAAVAAALLDANTLGFATVLIPHLILDDGEWRGDLRYDDPADTQAFFTSYGTFMNAAADLAARSGATVLSLGVELKGLSSSEAGAEGMRTLSAEVRRHYSGLLTYNANWDEAEQVRFWDATDLAGVNGYYPLVPDPVRGAESVALRLSNLALLAERDVLVLEVGYRSSPLSHVRPWEWPEQVEPAVDQTSQANAYAAVLSEWLRTPHVRGLLFWVVPTDPDDPASEPPHGFSPINKAAEAVIKEAFLGRAAP
ncbi:MAG: hypothetical protein IPG45_31555 [Deltaproteobacteria bacterium]|nr:hypothetical protein [Deltaproteobacteria bacterium]